jgi:hypothetical protein
MVDSNRQAIPCLFFGMPLRLVVSAFLADFAFPGSLFSILVDRFCMCHGTSRARHPKHVLHFLCNGVWGIEAPIVTRFPALLA